VWCHIAKSLASDGNLYVGTSAAELLHFVSIPPDPSDRLGRPVFIQASRLSPAFAENTPSRPGVQQILLLPRVGKACILCNGTVTFYSLPELSPVFGSKQVKNCNWIGGVDLNEEGQGDVVANTGETVTVLLSLNRRIQVVKIDEDVRAVRVGYGSHAIYSSELALTSSRTSSLLAPLFLYGETP
jgi:hypothetical protein